MSRLHIPSAIRREEHGFTLIEMLVSVLIGTIVTGAAFSFLIFTTEDVSHITARVGVDQTGRLAMQKIVSELHSSCVAPNAVPVLEGSNANVLIFVSQSGEESAFATVEKHKIIYKAGSGTTEGTLTEESFKSTGGAAPSYTWSAIPATTRLLTGVRQTEYAGKATPIFQYYRYYHEGDTPPSGHVTPPYGEINNTPTAAATTKEAEDITKVTVSFTLAPEGKESISFNHDRPVALEDSATFRLAPSSEASSNPNLPCTEKT
jgi:prepilin-type N-terminal cleavage/methylation domain-containing protein